MNCNVKTDATNVETATATNVVLVVVNRTLTTTKNLLKLTDLPVVVPSRDGDAPSVTVLNKPMTSYGNSNLLCSHDLDIDAASASSSSFSSSN